MEAVHEAINNAVAALKKTDLPKIINASVKPISDGISTLQTTLKELTEKSDPNADDPNADPNADPNKAKPDPQLNARLSELERGNRKLSDTVTALTKAKEEAEKRAEESDRHAQIQAALNKYTFKDDKSRKFAFDVFAQRVQRAEDGSLVADDLPAAKFIEDEMASLAGLLAPKQAGGAGAGGSDGAPRKGAINLDSIKPGMTAEETNAALAQMRKVAQ
jgi:uncharacterized phage infection (PIP) family protein YhgE